MVHHHLESGEQWAASTACEMVTLQFLITFGHSELFTYSKQGSNIMENHIFYHIIGVMTIVASTVFMGCNSNKSDENTIRFIIHDSYVSAPLYVMKELNLMDKHLSGSKIDLVMNNDSTAINEAFIAGQIDGAIQGLSGFLVGFDAGIPYKMFSSVAYSRLSLQTNKEYINAITDLGPNDKIAISSPTGMGGFMLNMAAEKYFDSYDALDSNKMLMGAPDATLALMNGTVSASFTTLNFRIVQNGNGFRTVFEDSDLFKSRTLTHYVVFNNDFYNSNPQLLSAFNDALEEAISLIHRKDDVALSIIADKCNVDKDLFVTLLDEEKNIYETGNFDNIDVFMDMAIKMQLIRNSHTTERMTFRP